MSKEINNTDEIIDVRDVISRYEELEQALISRFNDCQETEGDEDLTITEPNDHFYEWLKQSRPHDEEAEEFDKLHALLEELKGNGGYERFRGDWYPITLIRDSHFNDAMDEMLEDCGDMPKDIPSYLKVTVDYDALQMDYSSVELDGETYWYR